MVYEQNIASAIVLSMEIRQNINKSYTARLWLVSYMIRRICNFFKQLHNTDIIRFVYLTSLQAKFFRGNINMYLHFMPFFHTDMP